MAASQPAELQALTSFRITADYRRDETTFDIWAPGGREPAARLHKRGPILSREPFCVLTGPGLAEPAGRVARNVAWAADGTQVGTVAYQLTEWDKKLNKPWLSWTPFPGLRARRWRVEQPGLPPITGGPAGLARLRFNAITDASLGSDVLGAGSVIDYVMPFRFEFGMEGAPGFGISRRAGRSTLHVSVHDPRVDRRLVFSCAVTINSVRNPTLRKTAVAYTTNPFRR